MVIELTIDHIGTLIVAAGNYAAVFNINSVQIVLAAIGVLYSYDPGITFGRFWTGGNYIASNTDEQILWRSFGNLLYSPAFCNSTDVKLYIRVGKVYGTCLFIYHDRVKIHVHRCRSKFFNVGKFSVNRIVTSVAS